MNIELFWKLWREQKPGQQFKEYFYFMHWLCDFFTLNAIKNPTVVEIGIRRGAQARFYEQLLGARYIGIDISYRYAKPSILGDSHAKSTYGALLKTLGGRKAHVIFIDGDHSLTGVRMDYNLYGGLAPIIAFHDIYCTRPDVEVPAFWKGLSRFADRYKNHVFLEFFSPEPPDHYGIGVIVNENI